MSSVLFFDPRDGAHAGEPVNLARGGVPEAAERVSGVDHDVEGEAQSRNGSA